MITRTHFYCTACGRHELVDGQWRALWIDADGCLKLSPPLGDSHGIEVDDAIANATVFACGEGTALALAERFLQKGNFDADAVPFVAPGLTNPESVPENIHADPWLGVLT